MKRAYLPWLLAAITLSFHAVANPHYGFFRDELYFIACGRRPAFGYVDQPPLTPLLAAGTQLFGHSLFLLRLVPAICAAVTVYVTCLTVIEMGGTAFAQILASICVMLAPVLAAFGQKQGPDMIEMALWPLTALLVLRMVNGGSLRAWLAAGLVVGVAFQSKYSIVFFAVAMLLGLLVSTERRIMISKWFALGAALSVLIGLPNVLWQAHYGFPMWELLRNGQMGKNIVLSPVQFLLAQFGLTNPILAIVWIVGLFWLLKLSTLRWLAYGFLLLMAMMIALHAKHYYPSAIYPILFASGACAIEAWTAGQPRLRPLIGGLAALCGLVLIPLVEPILPVPTFIVYQKALQVAPQTSEHHIMRELPSDYADMHGWPELAATVGRVYDSLPAHERRQAAVFTADYGQAAAIEFFNPHVPVLSGHNQYWLWGPQGHSGKVIIDISGGNCGRSAHLFRRITQAGRFTARYVMAYEDNRPITICRGPNRPLSKLWPALKHYE
ncbi:MAG: glycosyltransferase family 39 protein [Candidatus Eremiobacteraeota bacterium]|nr:glycosyltransferase family 39 protein [Candidatus Eremiobacteraeota bacterium]